MDYLVNIWWAWLSLALALALLEISLPGFIFLGFAIGAAIMAIIIAILPAPFGAPIAIALFAALALAAWIGLRLAFRRQGSDARIITHDIND